MKKEIRLYIKYLLYSVVILLLFMLEIRLINDFTREWRYSFTVRPSLFLMQFSCNIAIGVVLGIDHLLLENKKKGRYSINLAKLIMMGLPALYLSLTIIVTFSGSTFISETLFYLSNHLVQNSNDFPIILAQVIFGYVVITSIYKKNVG